MDITQVKIFPVHEEKLKAFVSIVFDHCFMINDIKVIQGKDGLFLSMPSRRKRSGEFKDVAHPLNNETRRAIEERVLGEYRRLVDDATPRRPDRPMDEDLPSEASIPVREAPTAAGTLAASAGPSAGVPSSSLASASRDVPESAAPDHGMGDPGSESAEDQTSATPASDTDPLEEVQRAHLSDSFWSVG